MSNAKKDNEFSARLPGIRLGLERDLAAPHASFGHADCRTPFAAVAANLKQRRIATFLHSVVDASLILDVELRSDGIGFVSHGQFRCFPGQLRP